MVIGINGSPRLKWNCADLLDHALDGAKSAGAETKRVDLFKLKYSGCISCFACKKIGGPSFGRCVVRDDLTDLLNECLNADGIIIAAPVFFSDVPGAVRSFLERLWFPGYTYSKDGTLAYSRRVPSLMIYTMNSPNASYYQSLYQQIAGPLDMIIGPTSVLAVTDTLQFPDYSKYASEIFDGDAKKRRREEQFPKDCAKAREMGRQMAMQSAN